MTHLTSTPAGAGAVQPQTEANTFPDLVELDALRLTVIVDNELDFMSSVPKELGLTTQAHKLFTDKHNIDKDKSTTGKDEDHSQGAVRTIAFDFNDVCCGAHGLSILLTGIKGNVEHRVLFDTGPHSAIFLENAKRLDIEFENIEVVVLSHWHIDHSGGMLAAVEKIHEAKEKHRQHGHSTGTGDAAVSSKPSQYVAWGADPSVEGLEKAGGQVRLNGKAHTICDGFFGISGEIPRRTTYETGIPNHVRWSEADKAWQSEPEIMDERYLVALVKDKGVVVLTGCSHAGVINVCQDVKRAFGSNNDNDNITATNKEIFFIIGGFHLAGNTVEARIEETVSDMLVLNPSYMAPGHCSGWRAKAALEKAMPGKVVTLGVGSDFYITQHATT
ncbi:hypothetical protein EDD11_008600 [Mortierella claussenii]|nr:hypothetical protein EDD11_008600 [Mortierella claussenii]